MSSIFGEESVQNEVTATEFKVSSFCSDPSLILETVKLHRELKGIKKHPEKTRAADFADTGVFLGLGLHVYQARELFIDIFPNST